MHNDPARGLPALPGQRQRHVRGRPIVDVDDLQAIGGHVEDLGRSGPTDRIRELGGDLARRTGRIASRRHRHHGETIVTDKGQQPSVGR